jgi:hypothetical protein
MHKDATSIQKSALRVLLWVGLLLLVPYGKEKRFRLKPELHMLCRLRQTILRLHLMACRYR